MPDSVVEEIIERALKMQRTTEDPSLVKFMLKLKKAPTVFDLLKIEKMRVISTYEKLIMTKNINEPLMQSASAH